MRLRSVQVCLHSSQTSMRRRNRSRSPPRASLYRGCSRRTLLQGSVPFVQNGRDLVGIFLRDEIVGACFRLEQRGLDWQSRSIVRMQVEIAGGRLRTGRLIRETEGKCEAPQARGNQRRRQSLTTADEKVAP